MELIQRELLTSRILAGVHIINVGGQDIVVKPPTRYQKYLAQLEYDRALSDLRFDRYFTKKTIVDTLIALKIVPTDIDTKLSKIDSDIEKLKHQLYLNHIDPVKTKIIRKSLKDTRTLQNGLLSARHSLDHLTIEGYAEASRLYRLFSFCLESLNNEPINSPEIIEKVVIKINNERVSNENMRELARTEPWRSVWNAHGDSVFGVDTSEDQKTLILYSKMYDSVNKAHEPPDDKIINDDDMLDGWMIEQRKEYEREQKTKKVKRGKSVTNLDADEIYLFNQTKQSEKEFIKQTEEMNSFEAKLIKGQRSAALKANGTLSEVDMPDIKRDISIQSQQQIMDRFKRK